MAEQIDTSPIIVKKIKKGGHAHHGGSWKVAYADFVTAMMALFLLLWILETNTMEILKGISDYFDNPSIIEASGGASTAIIDFGGGLDSPKGEGGDILTRNVQEKPSDNEELEDTTEARRFEELKLILEDTMDTNPNLKEFKDQVFIDITDEGLRVQIVDQDKRPMFEPGSDKLVKFAEELLHEMAKVLDELPNALSISGHTDSAGFSALQKGYSNWELSADRANAARRELVKGGLNPSKIARVVGLADTVPFDADNPNDPVNRRISIVVLNKKTERKMKESGGGASKQRQIEKDKGTGMTRDLPDLVDELDSQANEKPPEEPKSKVKIPDKYVDPAELEKEFQELLGPP
jgi:chemotaxis protein MotB